jgi:NAD(P)-dependent dehydrogenase (short-subunit alcohol dehydrogenase family)
VTSIDTGTVLVTGPTRGLGRALVLDIAGRPDAERPDLLLVGRPGDALTDITAAARAAGATVYAIPTDLARLADVRAAAATAKDLLTSGVVRPLRALIANAGWMPTDTTVASADGYELTFAINHLAHAQLIGDLLGSFTAPARVVLLGSNLYSPPLAGRLTGNPGPDWRDPVDLARPAGDGEPSGVRAGSVAYSNAKLAVLYYAHELQRRVGDGINVVVFEPGIMPGTGLTRGHHPIMQAIGRGMARLPGTASPATSAPALACVALDEQWAHARDGAFVLIDKEIEVKPVAHDPGRERRLWAATDELLRQAAQADLESTDTYEKSTR